MVDQYSKLEIGETVSFVVAFDETGSLWLSFVENGGFVLEPERGEMEVN
jgi:hypothetical protein